MARCLALIVKRRLLCERANEKVHWLRHIETNVHLPSALRWGGGGARTLSLCNIVGDRQREGPLCQCGTPTVGFQNILIWSPPPPGPTSEGASLGKMSVPPGQPALLEKKSVSLQRDAHVWYHRVCILGPLGSHFFKVLWCYKSAEEMRVWDPLVAISSRCSGNTKEC